MADTSQEVQNPAYRGSAFIFFIINDLELSAMGQRLNRIIRFFETDIWRINQNNVSPVRFLFLEILKKLILAIRFFTAKRVLQKASALTYSTLLAIVPITAVVFAIAR